MSEEEKAIRRRLVSLEEEIMAKEKAADLENIRELEALRQVLQVYHDALKSERLNPNFLKNKKIQIIVRDEIINSFEPDLRVQLLCLLRHGCPT